MLKHLALMFVNRRCQFLINFSKFLLDFLDELQALQQVRLLLGLLYVGRIEKHVHLGHVRASRGLLIRHHHWCFFHGYDWARSRHRWLHHWILLTRLYAFLP